MVKIPSSVLQKHQLTSPKGCNLDIKGKYHLPDEIFAFIKKKKKNYLCRLNYNPRGHANLLYDI